MNLNFLPLVPLPRFLAEIPRILELHKSGALIMAGGCLGLGTLLIVLWVAQGDISQYSSHFKELRKERIRNGLQLYFFAFLYLIFGFYALALTILGFAIGLVYCLVRALKVTFAKA